MPLCPGRDITSPTKPVKVPLKSQSLSMALLSLLPANATVPTSALPGTPTTGLPTFLYLCSPARPGCSSLLPAACPSKPPQSPCKPQHQERRKSRNSGCHQQSLSSHLNSSLRTQTSGLEGGGVEGQGPPEPLGAESTSLLSDDCRAITASWMAPGKSLILCVSSPCPLTSHTFLLGRISSTSCEAALETRGFPKREMGPWSPEWPFASGCLSPVALALDGCSLTSPAP